MRVNCLSPIERIEAIERRLTSLEIGLRELNASIPQLSVFERGIKRDFRWFYDALDEVYKAFAAELPVANGTIPALKRVGSMDKIETRIILLSDSLSEIRRKVNNAEYASIQSSIKLERQLGIITESLSLDRSNRTSILQIRQLSNDSLYGINQANNKITTSTTSILTALSLGFAGIGITLATITKSIAIGFTTLTALINTRFTALGAVLSTIGQSIAGLINAISQLSITLQTRFTTIEALIRNLELSVIAVRDNLRQLIISSSNRLEATILNGFNVIGELIGALDKSLSVILSRVLELNSTVTRLIATINNEFNKLIQLLIPKFEVILERINQVRAYLFTLRNELITAITQVKDLLLIPIGGSFTLHPWGDEVEEYTFNNTGLGGLRDGILAIGQALDTVLTSEPTAAIPEIAGNSVRNARPILIIVYRAFKDGAWTKEARTYTIFFPDTAKVSSIFNGTLTLDSKEQGKYYARIPVLYGGHLAAYESTPARAMSFLTFLVSLSDPDHIPTDWMTKVTKGERYFPLALEGTFYAKIG
jgi:Flp pilus assembly pilin Flp